MCDKCESCTCEDNSLLISKVESLRRYHAYCEDSWYSCPKHEEGCCNEAAGDDCNCGADKYNKVIDEIIELLNNI